MNERAQTTIDFVLAIVLFLGVVTGALIVAQDIFDNRVGSQVDHRLEADRVVDQLVQTQLSTNDPYSLNKYCTAQYFDKYQDGTLDDEKQLDCPTPLSRENIQKSVGLPETRNLNITIHDFNTRNIASVDGTQLTAGTSADGESERTAYRVVTIDDTKYIIEVKIW